MEPKTIRFSDELWDRVTAAGEREGINASQLVREATIARLASSEALSVLREVIEEVLGEIRDVDERVTRIERALARRRP